MSKRMTNRIVRRPDRAEGGITPEEKARMDAHTAMWIKRAMRTDPIDPSKIVPAIEGLYAAAGLKKPRVVIVPSPLVMAFAYGASAAIWYARKNTRGQKNKYATFSATYAATRAATRAATSAATRAATDTATRDATYVATSAAIHANTYAAVDAATRAATRAATYAATYAATSAATDAAINNEEMAAMACREMAGKLGISCSKNWQNVLQGGNMWASLECYLTAFRDIIGLKLPSHKAYSSWEKSAIHGGYRVMHEEFCIVSDHPETLKVDAQNRPHCETGPSHRWRDGWSLYHWHGVKIPGEWIEDRSSLTPEIALTWENIEQRRAACEIVGWNRILRELDSKVIDSDDDPEIGTLIEVEVPQSGRDRFLRVRCGTGREFALPVPRNMKTALQANAWTFGFDDANSFIKPEVRT